MKLLVLSGFAFSMMIVAGAAQAQMNAPGNAPMTYDNSHTNFTKLIGGDSSTTGRLQGNHADMLRDLIYKDQQAIKERKAALKTAQTDEEKAKLKAEIRQLESDIIAIQQEG